MDQQERRIAIMQPYIFPYIGYFQLIHATNVFVFYDDVNFINRGWINRNRILVNGSDLLFTVPCRDASQNKLINEVGLADDPKSTKKLLDTIQMAYKKAPYFSDIYPLVESVINGSETTISGLAQLSVTTICEYLGLKKTFKTSSAEYDNRELKKADRLIDICLRENIREYVNPSGGQEIYTKEYYGERGVHLNFLIPEKIGYKQFGEPFVPWLSIIDVLMFNPREEIVEKILPAYQLK